MRHLSRAQSPPRRRSASCAPAPPLRALLESLSEGAALVAVDGRIEYLNPALAALLGLRKGLSILDAVLPRQRDEVAALLTRREGSIELALYSKKRTAVDARVAVRPAPASGFACVSVVNLSDRKKREDAVEATRLTRAVLQSAAGPVIVLNARGRILRCNRAASNLCGFNPETRPFEKSFPFAVEPRRGELDLWTGSSILSALQWGQKLADVPVVLLRSDGVRFHLLLSAIALRDRSGRIERSVVTLTDVTGQRRIEEDLRFLGRAGELLASSRDIEETFSGLARMVVGHFADRCAIDLGTRRVAVAPDGADFPVPCDKPALLQDTEDRPEERLRKAGIHSFISIPLVTQDRSLGHLMLGGTTRVFSTSHFELAKNVARRVAMAADNASLYQEAKEAARMREEFMSIASHELRTPLTSLTLVLGMMQRTKDLAKLPEYVPEAKRHAGSMARMISELLDISKMISRRFEIVPEQVDLAAVVREAAERIEGGIQVRAPRAVAGRWDRLRLEQVATNLLSNAVKYGEGRPVEARVSGRKGEARLEVRDQGRGIEAEALPRLFEPFHRAASAKGVPGLGMGLYVTRQIVEAHGGRIEVQSRVGKGTTVIVRLPR